MTFFRNLFFTSRHIWDDDIIAYPRSILTRYLNVGQLIEIVAVQVYHSTYNDVKIKYSLTQKMCCYSVNRKEGNLLDIFLGLIRGYILSQIVA